MEKAIKLLTNALIKSTLENATFSSPKSKTTEARSIHIQTLKDELNLKVEFRLKKHNDIKTISKEKFLDDHLSDFFTNYKQCLIKTDNSEIQILINKKGNAKIITKNKKIIDSKKHNRQKNYLIPDGTPCDFLIEIGIMDKYGKVKPNFYKKFKQINRFLEMVDDLYKSSNKDQFHIVDFGCGKSYLTFAVYYYFNVIKKSKVQITGIDLKQEVIDHCNNIALKLNYTELKFVHGFIHDFKVDSEIDFVITLHACDTATDDAILFSLKHQAENMMFVPCCQHELNKQINNKDSDILLKHGIFKDRMTAIVTDTIRSQLLESCGYKVQSMEFIDLEHTAKNILLRCVKTNKTQAQKENALKKYYSFKEQWNIQPYLEKKLRELEFIS
jgi:SAM-dependent methyltransferase